MIKGTVKELRGSEHAAVGVAGRVGVGPDQVIGDRLSLTAADFERLATAVLAEIDRKFVRS